MAQISVTIGGRAFRMACEDGEEPHLMELAAILDERVNGLRAAFGEIGDQRLTVMAALSLADERAEALARITRLEEELSRAREASQGANLLAEDSARRIAQAIEDAATRIDSVARGLDDEERD